MTVQFRCSHCGKRLSVERERVGVATTCDGCQRMLIVPKPRNRSLVRPAQSSPLSVSLLTAHNIKNGVCVDCGCSDVFIAHFSPECRCTSSIERGNPDNCSKQRSLAFLPVIVAAGFGISIGIIVMLSLLDSQSNEYHSPKPTSDSVISESDVTDGDAIDDIPPSVTRVPHFGRNETTEEKLRRVYRSQGIKYDDRMIREDARAIERLHRDLNK